MYDKLVGRSAKVLKNGSHWIHTYFPEHGLFSKRQSLMEDAVAGQLMWMSMWSMFVGAELHVWALTSVNRPKPDLKLPKGCVDLDKT